MTDDKTEQAKDVYVFKAPQQPPTAPPSNETGEIVGAVMVCIVILAVLLFLWKMVERKRKEMAQFQNDPEDGSSDEERQLPNSPKSEPTSPRRNFLPGLLAATRRREHRNVEEHALPNAVVDDEEKDNPATAQQAEELVLPNLSPITSIAWSQRGEACSGDTGYNSGFCRKDAVLRRRFKHCCFDEIELEIEHPRDIIYSLKRDKDAIGEEMKQRSEKNKKAVSEIAQCLDFLSAIREKIRECGKAKRKEGQEIREFLRRARETRIKYESLRNYQLNYSFVQQQTQDNREAFVSMQEWFDGLRLRSTVRQTAEELFLLRSQHRSAFERNECERRIVKESITQIEKCHADVSKVKNLVTEMRKQIESNRVEMELLKRKRTPPRNEEKTSAVAPQVETKTGFKFRIKFPLIKEKLVPPGGSKTSHKEQGDRCATCRQLVCKCFVSQSSCATAATEAAHCSNDVTKTSFVTSTPKQQQSGRAKAQDHPVTLKLTEVNAKDDHHDPRNPELSEREVRKALNRVPFVTSIRSIARNVDSGDWILDVVSAQPRLANVRFNCRGKTYVIGMVGDAKM